MCTLHLEIDEARCKKKSTTIDLSKSVRKWELGSNASVLHYFAVIHLLFIFYYSKMGLLHVNDGLQMIKNAGHKAEID